MYIKIRNVSKYIKNSFLNVSTVASFAQGFVLHFVFLFL